MFLEQQISILQGLEKYGIWFKYFPGLKKYGKKKAEYGKICVSRLINVLYKKWDLMAAVSDCQICTFWLCKMQGISILGFFSEYS